MQQITACDLDFGAFLEAREDRRRACHGRRASGLSNVPNRLGSLFGGTAVTAVFQEFSA
jgi:hypothetical protein